MKISSLAQEQYALLEQLLKTTFGTQAMIVDYTIANQRSGYLVLLVQLTQPLLKIAIKLAGPDAPFDYPFKRTASLHKLVAAHTSIPMPDILAVDTSCQHFPWRYFIKTYISGEEWGIAHSQMNTEELRSAYWQIGRAAAELHNIHFAGFGELDSDGEPLQNRDWLDALTNSAKQRIRSERLMAFFESVVSDHAHLFNEVFTPSLCHEDLHKHNIIFQHQDGCWHLATILDFDKAWAGSNESDLAKLDLWTNMTGDGFRQSYESIASISPTYSSRCPIYQLLWCLEYAAMTPAHLADTARICEALGIPPIESFE